MKKPVIAVLACFLFYACANEKHTEEADQDETPEVLNEQKNDVNFSSYSKRTYSDIIQQLFVEAQSKDTNLSNLNAKIEKVGSLKRDSLEKYHNYIHTNQNYWNTLDQYLNQLSDSVLKAQLNHLVLGQRKKYDDKVLQLHSAVKKLEHLEQSLGDQVILMKILVTQPMITNYQNNELPIVEPINSVISNLDTLIKNVKPYTQIAE